MRAIAYLRTSSAQNVGEDKDSGHRQRELIARYAGSADFEIVEIFYDAAVSGADPIEQRPGFSKLLDTVDFYGDIDAVIVEDASRFARELMVQELGVLVLQERRVRLIAAATGEDLTDTSDPMRKMFRQIAGAFHEYEKARLVQKLKSGRERKRLLTGKCEGRKSISEMRPEVGVMARELRARGITYQQIANILAVHGHLAASGKPFEESVVGKMLQFKGALNG